MLKGKPLIIQDATQSAVGILYLRQQNFCAKSPPHADPSADRREHLNIATSSSSMHSSAARPGRPRNEPLRAGDDLPSPPNKRQKRSDPANMYSFTTNQIDLTSPPPQGSPLKLRLGGNTLPPNGSSPTKLLVKNFQGSKRPDTERYFQETWERLKKALDIIFGQKDPCYSKEQLYRSAELVCRQGKASELFKSLLQECKAHVATIKTRLLAEPTLQAVTEAWATWKQQLATVRSIFYYLDRSYLLHSVSLPQIEVLGVQLFRSQIFTNPSLKPKILDGACELLLLNRKGQLHDASLIRQAVSMFHDLHVYTSDFEPQLLRGSKTYFRTWASANSEGLGLYISQSCALIEDEKSRCATFALDESTKRQLIAQIDDCVIAGQVERLINPYDVGELMSENQVGTLHDLFKLLQRKSLVEKLRLAFEQYISTTGFSIVFDEKRVADMVVRLLHFKKRLDTFWTVSFERQQALGYGLKEAFETFINKTEKTKMTWDMDNDKPGEMIAKYLDAILRGGAKAIPQNPEETRADEDNGDEDATNEDAIVNEQLDQALELFRFVHGKATFEAFYKKDLAKRLLMNRSASADAEKSMLMRLKSECGAGFTQHLEQMFKDMELAREEISSYKALLEDRHQRPPVDLNVSVLTASAWPSYPDAQVEIPPEIQKATASFEDHYKAKHSNRKLDWKHGLAHCQMKAHFPRGDKEIIVSSFQAAVMLHFSDKALPDVVGYTELQAATKLPDVEIKRTLQSLACARYRVLTKSPKGKEVNPTDTFTLNANFTDPKYRIKINQVQLKETREENRATHERVAADRQYETQAAIVRIMKGKKKLMHAQLMAAVIEATKSRGSVNPDDIKKQIEKSVPSLDLEARLTACRLIDKDYLERLDDGAYAYLA